MAKKPVIAAVNGPCIGAGVDLVCHTDIRYCTIDTYFQIKEVVLGIPPDLGSIQLLPILINNQSSARELIYSGRKFFADEALRLGFVSQIFETKEQMMAKALKTAELISSHSPIAIKTCKNSLNYSRDHSLIESMKHINLLNQNVLQGSDFAEALNAVINKTQTNFQD